MRLRLVPRKLVVTIGAAAALLAVLASTAVAHPGRPDHVWKGPLPDPDVLLCTLVFDPVHDVHGTTYGNWCLALKEGVRVTWNGFGH